MEAAFKQKICLLGEGGVGKSSLIKRFVSDQFSDGYICTIGTKITKKELIVKSHKTQEANNVTMLIWDIMGQQGFRNLLKEAYFFGTEGAIAVCDITRKKTLFELRAWIESLYSVTKDVPIVFIGNKSDLLDKAEIRFEDVRKVASEYEGSTVFLSSAKSGINVNLAFKALAEKIVQKMLNRTSAIR